MYGFGDVIRIYQQVRQNPAMLSQLLYQNGRVNQNQYQAIQNMNPQDMANYLSQNGIMGQGFQNQGQQSNNPAQPMN